MQPPQKSTCGCGVFIGLSRQFPQAVKQRVNNNDVRVKTIDSRRKDQIAVNLAGPPVPPSQKPV